MAGDAVVLFLLLLKWSGYQGLVTTLRWCLTLMLVSRPMLPGREVFTTLF
jgi:hypothetical protein